MIARLLHDRHATSWAARSRCSEGRARGGRAPRQDRPRRAAAPALAAVAPGTPLRDGLERILRGRTGALIVLGYDKSVEALCTGGFALDVEFSATRLRELAKMDGALVIDAELARIMRANVQLVPDSSDRHRRVRHPAPHRRAGRQADRPAGDLGVSQSMHIIALYVAGHRYVLEDSDAILSPRQPGAGHPGALQAAPRRGEPARCRRSRSRTS